MQRVRAADLRPCSCPGRLSLRQARTCSRSSKAQKTCMKANTFQVEVDVPEGLPVDEVMKRFKNESRRVNTVLEVRRRRYFENYQDMLKRKEKQKHMNKRMAKFDKFVPRLEDRVDPHTPVPFGEMFGQGVDDLIGGGEFGASSFFGSGASLFTRSIDNPDSEAKSLDRNESPVGRWGSRRTSDNGAAARNKAKSAPEAPLTARARKAAQAASAQGKPGVSPAGKPAAAKNQPKSKQRQAPANNGAAKTGAAPVNSNGTSPSGKAGAPANGKAGAPAGQPKKQVPKQPKGQAPAPKKRWQTQRQKKARAPGAASTDQPTAKAPSQGAPAQKKQPVSV
ncbi:hypothetical protein ABBQ38_014896 [Trebouxia sp. C0009 RCD-2024]